MDKKDPHSLSERHDPGHRYDHSLDPTDDYGKSIRGRGLRRLEEAEARRSANNDTASLDGSDNLQDLESRGAGWDDNFKKPENPQQQQNTNRAQGIIRGIKKNGPLIGILGGTTGIGILLSLFGAMLAPFMWIANVDLDQGDILSINRTRTTDQLEEKFDNVKTGGEKVSLGCGFGGKLPLKCKMKSVSPWLEDKLKGVGIEIEGTKKFGGRIVPDRYIYKGTAYNAEEFAAAMRGGNGEFWSAYNRAMNSNWIAYKGKTFIKGVLAKYGLTEKPRTLTGDAEDMTKQLANNTEGSGDVGDPPKNFTDTGEKDSEGKPIWEDENGSRYTDSQKETLLASNPKDPINANKKPMSQMSIGTLEKVGFGLNVVGFADAACTIRNLIGQASIAAKISNAEQLVKYAMPILTAVKKLQAGDTLKPEEGEAVMKVFMDTDARKTIAGLVASDTNSDEMKTAEVPNPDYGKNVMDSPLYQVSAGGGVAQLSAAENNYSLGYGADSILRTFAESALDLGNFVSTVKNYDSCHLIQHKATRLIGIGVGALITITGILTSEAGIGVAILGVQGAKGAATIIAVTAASMVLTRAVNAVFTNSLITDTMDEAPLEVGAALWTGMSVLHSTNAQMRGMMPGSADEIVAYQQEQNVARQEYIALERQKSNMFDIRNPYSTMGSIAFAMSNALPNSVSSSSIASLPASLSSFVFGGFSSFLNPYSAKAASLNPERYKLCDDAEYQAVGIDADMQCNVRYVMPSKSRQWSPIEAAQRMEDLGFVEADTTTGYPQGYSPPQPEKLQSGAMNMVKGAAKSFFEGIVKTVYNTESYDNKYGPEATPKSPNGGKFAKFLDYCVYRAMPFGKTYEDNASIDAVGESWLNGSECRRTDDEDINLFRIYVFDVSVTDDMEGPVQDNSCEPSLVDTGSSTGKASAETINAAIEKSEQNNPNNPHPLHGKGEQIISLSNQYGVNPDFIAVTLLAETQFGTDGAIGPRYNNFGYNKLNDFNECEPFTVGSDKYNCYNTPEKGIEGILKNLTDNPVYKTVTTDPKTGPTDAKPGTIAAVRPHYCPNWDGECSLDKFLAMGKAINIPIEGSDPVFTSAGIPPSPNGSIGGVRTDSLKLSQTDLERKIATYGLPAPQANGDNGYEALAKQLKEDPNALWGAQSFLAGEKNASAKGIDVKQYLTTAWVWFETGSWPDPYEVNCMSNTQHPTSETCRIGTSPDKVQVAGYQAWDVMNRFTEVYKKLYSEDELQSVMRKVLENSSKASIEEWKYDSSALGKIQGATLADIYPDGDRDYGIFNDDKRQFLSFVLGKDPNMAAALNSFAVSDDDVIKHISGPGCGPGWASYICDDDKQLISNMMMALYLIDDGSVASGVQCAGAAAGRGAGEGIEAVWGGTGEKDLSYGFGAAGVADWYGYGAKLGTDGTTHTGTDIPMDPYAPVYSPVEGIVVCERNGVGEGIPGVAGCAGAGDYSGTTTYGEKCMNGYDSSRPRGAGTVMIKITSGGVETGDYLRLGHLAESIVKLGDKVSPNQQIGFAGCMNGWHTHVEYFIPAPGVTSTGMKLVDPVMYLGGGQTSA